MDKETKLGLNIVSLLVLIVVLRVLFIGGAAFAIGGVVFFMIDHLEGMYRLWVLAVLVWMGMISYVGYQQLNYSFAKMLDGLIAEAESLEDNEK